MPQDPSLKHKTITSTFWKFGERLVTQIVGFIVSVILARLLMPEDFGVIVLVSVFVNICDKIVICGFATSLIQKKEADDCDFSTVLYFSLAMSGLLYLLLFFTAPFIASFYSEFDATELVNVIRVLGLSLFVLAINSVQHAYVSRNLQFKRYFWSVSGGTLISAIVGLSMAYSGFGVWALVGQILTMSVADTLILWFTVKWRPVLQFSLNRFKGLFSYGWKLFVASIIKTIYNDLRSLVIGKVYTPANLAFYNRGQSFPQLVDTNVIGTIDSVFFPVLSKVQDSSASMKAMLRRVIKTSSFILMPFLAGLAAVADPLIEILLTNKWAPCVPFLQILSFSFLFSSVEIEDLQAIKAIGRSDIVLRLEAIKKIVGIIILIISVPLGIKAIAYGMLVSQVISAMINAFVCKPLLGYSLKEQFKDIFPYLVISLLMFATIFLLSSFWALNPYLDFLTRVIVGIIIYVGIMVVLKDDSLLYLNKTLNGYFRRTALDE